MFPLSDCGVVGSGKVGGVKLVEETQLVGQTFQKPLPLVATPLQSVLVRVTFATGPGKNQYVPLERSMCTADDEEARVDPTIVYVDEPGNGAQELTRLSLTEPVKTASVLVQSAVVHDVAPPGAYTIALADSLIVH
jgi:hypothetical protein